MALAAHSAVLALTSILVLVFLVHSSVITVGHFIFIP